MGVTIQKNVINYASLPLLEIKNGFSTQKVHFEQENVQTYATLTPRIAEESAMSHATFSPESQMKDSYELNKKLSSATLSKEDE